MQNVQTREGLGLDQTVVEESEERIVEDTEI